METLQLALPFVVAVALASCSGASSPSSNSDVKAAPAASAPTLADFKANSLEGEPAPLEKWRGKVVLIVNVASQCGFTKQYAGLEALHKELESRGFAVLGFPCNEFGGQEPGDAKEIRAFCTENYQVTFPMFEKVKVKPGEGLSPIYAWLEAATGQVPSWNFCKYLVSKDGKPIAFYSSKTTPDAADLRATIETALAAK